MKKSTFLIIFSFVFMQSINLFAKDFLDVQNNIEYGPETSIALDRKGVFVAVASEDSLKYCEYDLKMRIIKQTVWADDFSTINLVTEWMYEEDSNIPYKKIETNKNDNLIVETLYVYDEDGRTIKETVRDVTNKDTSTVRSTEYLYHKEMDKNGSLILRADTMEYVNGTLSKKVIWISVNKKEVTLYFNNNIESTIIYDNGIRKSEVVIQNGEQIGQHSWD